MVLTYFENDKILSADDSFSEEESFAHVHKAKVQCGFAQDIDFQ
jgi:hypothetical protein